MKWLILIISFLYALNPFEANTNTTIETNNFKITENNESEIVFDDNFVSLTPKVNLAIVVDKEKFFKYIPSFINAINAYLIQKNIDYSLKVYSINDPIPSDVTDIILLGDDVNTSANTYNTTIYKKGENNRYYGGFNYKSQIDKLSFLISKDKIFAINEDKNLSISQFNYEKSLFPYIIPYTFPKINYYSLRNSYIFFNTSAPKTAQMLSKLTFLRVKPILKLSTQIDYDPILLEITQKEDVKNLIVANSIINPPLLIQDYALLANSDIKYNWLNYAGVIFTNKIYNSQNNLDEFYMNDFGVYIFDNQIIYKTKLYQIVNRAFKEIDF